MTEEEKAAFEDDKDKFYKEQEDLIKVIDVDIAGRKTGGALSRVIEKAHAERESWEKQAKKEIEEGLTEESNIVHHNSF